jgi:aminomethyltransferase
LSSTTAFDVVIKDISDETALIAVQGPGAVAMVASLSDRSLDDLKRFHFTDSVVGGVPSTVSRTGYTGEDGFELFCDWGRAPELWKTLTAAGGVPCGLGARDVLRLEAAYPLYGHELDETHTPLESGTGWATKLTKPDFIGRKAVLKQKHEGVPMTLAGLRMTAPANSIPREGFPVFSASDDGPIGVITSGTLSPTVGGGIAMVRLRREEAAAGTSLLVDIRGRQLPAEVVKLPFYRNGV